jgi:mRNA interferase RelE/StbE
VQKLSEPDKLRIKNGLEKLLENPRLFAVKLIDKMLGQYRYRVGDYRVIFDIEGDHIIILRIGHRREIYRR